eukprot:jgi/Mesvir1/19915/Mv13186-RA.1
MNLNPSRCFRPKPTTKSPREDDPIAAGVKPLDESQGSQSSFASRLPRITSASLRLSQDHAVPRLRGGNGHDAEASVDRLSRYTPQKPAAGRSAPGAADDDDDDDDDEPAPNAHTSTAKRSMTPIHTSRSSPLLTSSGSLVRTLRGVNTGPASPALPGSRRLSSHSHRRSPSSPPSSPFSPAMSPATGAPFVGRSRSFYSSRSAAESLKAMAGHGGAPPRAVVGLQNLGNTCFMNAAVQSLSNTPALALFWLRDGARETIHSGRPKGRGLALAFSDLIKELWSRNPPPAVCPSQFLEQVRRWAPQFKGGRQHDAQEFLRFLLDGLHVECNRIATVAPYKELEGKGTTHDQAMEAWQYHRSRHDSVIQDIFCGQLQSTIECQKCHRRSHCFDPFLDLSIPIPRDKPANKQLDLLHCLAAFFQEERLEGQEAPYCPRCKESQTHVKKLSVYRFPTVLVIHIKRISGSRFSTFSKDMSNVVFALKDLDLEEFHSPSSLKALKEPDAVYNLFAISNHSGSLGGGHYTAHCLNVDDGQWYNYNDSTVSLVKPDKIAGPSAYVLFYDRRA